MDDLGWCSPYSPLQQTQTRNIVIELYDKQSARSCQNKKRFISCLKLSNSKRRLLYSYNYNLMKIMKLKYIHTNIIYNMINIINNNKFSYYLSTEE